MLDNFLRNVATGFGRTVGFLLGVWVMVWLMPTTGDDTNLDALLRDVTLGQAVDAALACGLVLMLVYVAILKD